VFLEEGHVSTFLGSFLKMYMFCCQPGLTESEILGAGLRDVYFRKALQGIPMPYHF
jgi:hypothetical protein